METIIAHPTKALRMTSTFSYTDRFGCEWEYRTGDLLVLGKKRGAWELLKSGLRIKNGQGKGKHVLIPNHTFVAEAYTLQIPTVAVQSSSSK